MTASTAMRLAEVAFYGTGGSAEAIVAPASIEQLATTVKGAVRERLPLMLLGGGTNSLISDEHFPGVVILFSNLNGVTVEGTTVRAGAGVDNSVLSHRAFDAGLDGCGWMFRLPGQLGGTVRMNARCYGGEISQIATRVTVVSPDGDVRLHRRAEVFRGYKDTTLMTSGELVAEVEFSLAPSRDREALKALMKRCEVDRASKGQFDWPSCGCVFKNDYQVGVPSGVLLDEAGAKSLARGKAVVNPHHANFVYNQGASARELLELTFAMREAVYERFGVWMEYEMEVLGVWPEDLRLRLREARVPRRDEQGLEQLRERFRAQSSG